MKKIDLREREDLQDLRDQATLLKNACDNSLWVEAYKSLENALDRLDSMNARIEVLNKALVR